MPSGLTAEREFSMTAEQYFSEWLRECEEGFSSGTRTGAYLICGAFEFLD